MIPRLLAAGRFINKAFAEHLSAPVGVEYADGQYWDDITVSLPKDCKKIVASLLYQSVSWDYIKFLAEENTTDDWGKRLHDAWTKTGRCAPEVIAGAEFSR